MGLQHFTNAERMNTISELVREDMDKHINEGGLYYDSKAKLIAKRAVDSCMPEMSHFLQQTMLVDASDSLLLEDLDTTLEATTVKKFDAVHVLARLSKVELQAFRLTSPELEIDMDFYDYALYAVMQPQFIDPDPADIVFGKELYVPFGGIKTFQPTE